METRNILKNKYYLYITEFFAGVSVMAVELGASRLLAPYFSSSQIVWTIIIGTIMIAMALGNIWGGRSADKDPNPDKLYRRIIIAAIWIAAIPLVGKYIIIGISALLVLTVNNNFLVIAAFISCMVIFVFPLFLLGTVTPSLAKYTMDNLEENGKTVGTLGAFNTVGSIIGTFMPTFVTIPAVGTSITFLIFSGILLILGLAYFFSKKSKTVMCVASIILFILCSIFGSQNSFAFWENNLLYEGESIYNYLQVKDTDDSVLLSTNVLFGVQSVMTKNDELTGMYYDYALAAPIMAGIAGGKEATVSDREATSVSATASNNTIINDTVAPVSATATDDTTTQPNILILGMGTGTFARQCTKYFNNVNIEGVEIDQKITNLAHRYFKMSDNMKVTTYDGRAYLQAIDKKYDVIMVDAYQDITIPFQMSSVEFFTMVKEHLTDNGVMVVNMNMYTNDKGNINEYLMDTIGSVFNNVYTVDVRNSSNRELFASNTVDINQSLKNNITNVADNELKVLMSEIYSELELHQKGDYILTDDKAPVELLGMKVIDSLIKDEIGYYKRIFKEEGIQGLLNQM